MTKTVSLNQNTLFKRLYYKGKSKHCKVCTIFYMRNNAGVNRLGFTVTKKVGKAVKRNRVRRLLYEAFRLIEPRMKVGYDICIVAKADTLTTPFAEIVNMLRGTIKKAELLS